MRRFFSFRHPDIAEDHPVKKAPDPQGSPAAFFFLFPHPLSVDLYDLGDGTTQEEFELNLHLETEDYAQYNEKITAFRKAGLEFVEGEAGVKLLRSKAQDKQITINIAVQVKGYTITWYFWTQEKAHQDAYSQEWRDRFYDAIAIAHSKVPNGCNLYYRGSDAFHVKTMHNSVAEKFRNHQHYRTANNAPITPDFFRTQLEHLYSSSPGIVREFLGNVGNLNAAFQAFERHSQNNPAKIASAAGRPVSMLNDQADMIEFSIFGWQQELWRCNPITFKGEYQSAVKRIENELTLATAPGAAADTTKIQELTKLLEKVNKQYERLMDFRMEIHKRARALGSDRARTRPLEGLGENPILMTTKAGDEAPSIPLWAISLRKEVASAMQEFAGILMAAVDHESYQRAGVKVSARDKGPAFFQFQSCPSSQEAIPLLELASFTLETP